MIGRPARRARTPAARRATAGWIGAVVAVLALYAGTLLAYGLGGGTSSDVPAEVLPGSDDIAVLLTARDFDAAPGLLRADLRLFLGDNLVDEGGLPVQPITVDLAPTVDDSAIVFEPGRRVQARPVTLQFDGAVENWPLDGYRATVTARVGDGSGPTQPVTLVLDGDVEGWHLDETASGSASGGMLEVQFSRAVGVVVVSFFLLGALIALPILALRVAVTLFRGRGRWEPGFLTWIATTLIAAIAVRGFLPGSPPAGSWVDISIVLWVLIGLVAALALAVAAWSQREADADGSAAVDR